MINFNQNKILSGKLRIVSSIIGVSTLGLLSSGIPTYAGAQSMLDPYANIQPASSQSGAESLGNRTSTKKPRFSGKTKAASPIQTVSTTNSAAAPGFVDGLKEIGHGYGTVFKASGRGIVNGARSIGSTIKSGFGAAGSKIASAPKAVAAKTPKAKKKHPDNAVAMANSSALVSPRPNQTSNSQPLPGKPLGPLADTVPHSKVAKAGKVGPHKNAVASAFDKINIFSKHKKTPTDIAANNSKPGT